MKTISIDIETYSSVDLNKCGVYKYAEAEDFEILLFAYAVDDEDVQVIDLANGDNIPLEILQALVDTSITKWAFNSQFERVCLSTHIRNHYPSYFAPYSIDIDTTYDYLDPKGWQCTMTWAAYLGLPLSLEGVGAVLNLENQKLKEGKDLIKYFCMPCKPTKVNGQRSRNLAMHAPDKWSAFKAYNKRDVEVEMAIQAKLAKFPVPDFVWEEFFLDQTINDRGIRVDMQLASNAIAFDARSKESITEKLKDLTGIENPNSVMQLHAWLGFQGVSTTNLDKKAVADLIATTSGVVHEVLLLRQQLAKSSVKKYQAMENAVCIDGRARGMFRFYGANRSGRWAGRGVQLQNLPRNYMPDLEQARELVKQGDYKAMELLYDDIPDTLSQLIRTAFVPRGDCKFVVADFSSIEARVLAHLACETHTIEAFARGDDLYCATASAMFGVPVEKHGVNGELRQKGKIATLACGYGGSVGALTAMGALDMGLKQEELKPIVDSWRAANPNIVRFWWAVDSCAMRTVKDKVPTETNGIRFTLESGILFITLPSGRRLAYIKPQIGTNQFGGECITYEGIGAVKKWERLNTYGPKLVENIVQAVSRDILAYAMRNLSFMFICAHVHDELIIECNRSVSLKELCTHMSRTPPWLPGLSLSADGFESNFYKKD